MKRKLKNKIIRVGDLTTQISELSTENIII